MIVKVEGEKYRFYFERKQKPHHGIHTRCVVEHLDEGAGIWTFFDSDSVSCYAKDRFVKEEGRKKALTKLLKHTMCAVPMYNRAFRRAMWEEYFKPKHDAAIRKAIIKNNRIFKEALDFAISVLQTTSSVQDALIVLQNSKEG